MPRYYLPCKCVYAINHFAEKRRSFQENISFPLFFATSLGIEIRAVGGIF